MFASYRHVFSNIAIASSMVAALASAPAPAAVPSPPPSICIDGKCIDTAPSSTSGAITGYKWYPGTYVFPGSVRCDSGTQAADFVTIDEIAKIPQVKGVYIRWEWNCFEGDSPGDYAAAFARIDSYIARLAPLGKKLMLSVWPMYWGTCTSAEVAAGRPNRIPLPAYIKNTPGWVYYCNNSRTYTLAFNSAGAVDRLIALSAALAARYDNNPTVVMWEPHEETAGLWGDPAAGWNWDAAQTQWKRLFAAMATQWKHTIVRDAINWMKDAASVQSDVAASGRPGVAFGGADSMPESIFRIMANYAYRGMNYPAETPNSSFVDYREIYPWVAETQGGDIYGSTGTLQDYQTYAHDTMHSRFIIWTRQSWDGYTPRYWSNVLPWLKSGGSAVYSTACPKGWACNTQ